MLSQQQIDNFHTQGFIKLEDAFDKTTADAAREILWRDTKCDPNDPTTWTQPVVWLGMYSQEPFIAAANTRVLHEAFDQLVGKDKWQPVKAMGSFPVRFPSPNDPGDGGWHVDASFPGKDPNDYFSWRINSKSKGRALLMLFLFSDVGENDAPTRIRVGSHHDVAQLLENYGDEGLSFTELASKVTELPQHEIVFATGSAGTVYLCHPFIVHGAQPHRGSKPRFMAQPPLLIKH